MEDEYELVSKEYLKELKEENKRLKEQLKTMPIDAPKKNDENKEQQIELINKIIDALHAESQKERELILANLNDIKELNKSTLDNVLSKTQSLDNRLESMINTLKDLTNSLKELMSEIPTDSNEQFEEILKGINAIRSSSNNHSQLNHINQKVLEIEQFMNNLKLLLAQIKPSDMKLG